MKRRIQHWLGITAWIEAMLKDQRTAREERIALDDRIFGLEERADKCEVLIAKLQGSRTVDDVRILELEQRTSAIVDVQKGTQTAIDTRLTLVEVEVAKLQAAQPLQIVRESPQAKAPPIRAKNFREFRQAVEIEEEATSGV